MASRRSFCVLLLQTGDFGVICLRFCICFLGLGVVKRGECRAWFGVIWESLGKSLGKG